MADYKRGNILIVWGGALVLLVLFSYDFLKQTISSRNAGTLMVLLVSWFGWAVLTYGIRRGLFGVEGEEVERKRRIGDEPAEVVERGPDGAWVRAREEEDEEERVEARRLDMAEALIDRYRESIGAAEGDGAWEVLRGRLVVAFAGQRVEDFRTQMIGRLGTEAFKYLVDVWEADNGLGAAAAVSRKFGEGFAVVGEYDVPMQYVVYEVRKVVGPLSGWGMTVDS